MSVQLQLSFLFFLQWSSFDLISNSMASRSVFRQEFAACLVAISVAMSSFRTRRSWSEAGWLDSRQPTRSLIFVDVWYFWTRLPCAVAYRQKQRVNNWREEYNTARGTHGGFFGFCMASFSECVIWARNTCQQPASSPIANLHACKEVHDTNVHAFFSMKTCIRCGALCSVVLQQILEAGGVLK